MTTSPLPLPIQSPHRAAVAAIAAALALALQGCDRRPATPPQPSTAGAGSPALSVQSDS